MRADVFTLAAEVIRTANRQKPADRVLREVLTSSHGVSPEEARRVSRTVFAYYRWFKWAETRKGVGAQLQYALQLADRYAQVPNSFAGRDLIQRVVPDWVHKEMEVSEAFARVLQVEPKVWLRARPGQGRVVAKKLGHCRAAGTGALTEAIEYTGRQDLFTTPQFHAGAFELQDLSSQIVSLVCDPKPGQTWWDACAGEGGKLLHLSDLMQNKGLIWASDRAEWRLKSLKRRAGRAQVFNYRTVLWDGNQKLPTRTKFDGTLVDAPCSGIGTWHRNPHARWTTTPQDVKELAALQLQLLVNASRALKPGGKLVYSVCTLARSETHQLISAFLKQRPDLRLLTVGNPLSDATNASQNLWLRTEQMAGNGMFIALFGLLP